MPAVALDAALVADSVATSALARSLAFGSSAVADSSVTAPLARTLGLDGSLVADSAQPPSQMLSTDGMLSYVVADSAVTAVITNSRPIAAALAADSTATFGSLSVYRLPPPNVPQPLPRGPVPLRIVPPPPVDPQLSISTTTRTTRRGL